MPPSGWFFMFAMLIIGRYVTGASVAEEINFEVSNMRELAKNDPQVQQLDKTEYDQDESDTKSDLDDPDLSPSEIVETHVLPDESTPEEVNVQVKRPRRRRRRRRRKRPKPTPDPENVDAYYSVPEEEAKRKPIKYRHPEINDEIPQEASTTPRRRNVKRRRRPHKRPISDDIAPTAFENLEHSTDEQEANYTNNNQPVNSQNLDERIVPYSPKTHKSEPEHTKVIDTSRKSILPQSEVANPTKDGYSYPPQDGQFVSDDNTKNRFSKISLQEESYKIPYRSEDPPRDDHLNRAIKLPNQEYDTTSNLKRRKRPSVKTNNTTEADNVNHETELQNAETKGYNHSFRKQNLNETTKSKIEINEAVKKDGFKIRRLPPTSAILRHVKIRPLKKNETQIKIDENINNLILLHNESTIAATPEIHDPAQPSPYLPTSVPVVESNAQSPSEKTLLADKDNFESLLIKNTEPTPFRPTAIFVSTSTTTSSTTENTAFIYVPCNHTLNGVLKHKFNFTNENTTLVSKVNKPSNTTNSEPEPVTVKIQTPTDEDTTNAFKTVAVEELEKLLQHVKSETTSVPNTSSISKDSNETRNLTQHYHEVVDSRESGPIQNYQFHINNPPKTRIFQPAGEVIETKSASDGYNREPKWFQDYTKYQKESKEIRKYENAFVKSSTVNKDLILSYTSTPNSNFVYNDVDSDEGLEYSLHLRNNTFPRKYYQESLVHRSKNHAERKKLPLAVKSAIIISGAILALAVLGFFALLLSCKIRQAKSRMKCHRELYRENFQNSEFRHSSRSTSPVMSKSNYNGRSFVNNMQPNMATNRNYYLWQTLRKTFQYD